MLANIMLITIGSAVLIAHLANNTSVLFILTALKKFLSKNPLTIQMNDFVNFENVGSIGTTLPQNNRQLNTEPGDIILYQGRNLVIYNGFNSYSLTPIGKIEGKLKSILGTGSVSVTFSLPKLKDL